MKASIRSRKYSCQERSPGVVYAVSGTNLYLDFIEDLCSIISGIPILKKEVGIVSTYRSKGLL